MTDLAGLHALVTGGTSGIGRALCACLEARGARISTCGRDVRELAAAHPTWRVRRADLARAADRVALAAWAVDDGPVDLVINNAGIQQALVIAGAPLEAIAREIEVNLTAVVHLSALLVPHLAARPIAWLVNVTSGLALVPKRAAPVYCATKAAVRGFTRALRYQLEGTSVRVVEALPPLTATSMTGARGARAARPDAVARAIVAGIERGRREVRIGQVRALFAIHRVSPGLAARIVRG